MGGLPLVARAASSGALWFPSEVNFAVRWRVTVTRDVVVALDVMFKQPKIMFYK